MLYSDLKGRGVATPLGIELGRLDTVIVNLQDSWKVIGLIVKDGVNRWETFSPVLHIDIDEKGVLIAAGDQDLDVIQDQFEGDQGDTGPKGPGQGGKVLDGKGRQEVRLGPGSRFEVMNGGAEGIPKLFTSKRVMDRELSRTDRMSLDNLRGRGVISGRRRKIGKVMDFGVSVEDLEIYHLFVKRRMGSGTTRISPAAIERIGPPFVLGSFGAEPST